MLSLTAVLSEHDVVGVLGRDITVLVVEIGRVSEQEAVARDTPVPAGDEAAAPTIDAWFEDSADGEPVRSIFVNSSGIDSFFLDPEKVITEWPGLDGRVLEDAR